MTIRRINTRAELVELARELGMPGDWHEPDNADITATVHGDSFDNAMSAGDWYGPDSAGTPRAELHVILRRIPGPDDNHHPTDSLEPVAVVNLANLFAWACRGDR